MRKKIESIPTVFKKAPLVWRPSGQNNFGKNGLDLKKRGSEENICNYLLTENEYSESDRRGGDGIVASFNNPNPGLFELDIASIERKVSWISISGEKLKDLRTGRSSLSLYIRTFFDANNCGGTLLFFDSIGL